MAAVSLPSHTPYSRRVSFNNLRPEEEGEDPSDMSKFYSYSASKEPTTPTDPSKLFGNNWLQSPFSTTRKRLRLPDPPSKSILKNKLTASEISHNIDHVQSAGDDPRGPGLESGSDSDDEGPAPPPDAPRRKSYSQMSYDELMALDPQFAKPKVSNLENFKFDSVSTYYSPGRRNSSSASATAKPKQTVYPTSNENNYKSVSLTMKHEQYEDAPYPRTLLTVISGRAHTWNSLDWLLMTDKKLHAPTFLQDGDYLVVAALVPLKFMDSESKTRKKGAEEKVQAKCERLLQYILDSLPDTRLKLKITVELVMDVPFPDPAALASAGGKRAKTGTKHMLQHIFEQYQPSLVVVGNKSTSLNFKYPMRIKKNSVSGPTHRSSVGSIASGEVTADEFLVKVSSYLVKYSTVPVICVGNSTIFHRRPKRKPVSTVSFLHPEATQKPPAVRKDSTASDTSIESYGGEGNNDSSSQSSNEVNLSDKVAEFATTRSEARFAAMLDTICASSLAQSKDYLAQVKADRLTPNIINSNIHQMYISGNQGRNSLKASSGSSGQAYRVKSMISYSEEDEKKNEKMLHEKKAKRPTAKPVKEKKKSFLQKIGLKKS